MSRAAERPVRVLITARDAGAAQQNRAFVDAARRRGGFAFQVVAQEPAARCFSGMAPRASVVEGAGATAAVERAFGEFEPDFVLAGLSGFDAGVDEAAIALARRCGVPAGAIQDYWGYLGPVGSTLRPDVYFVLDEYARTLTRQRVEPAVHVRVTGSPKHEAYAARIGEWTAAEGLAAPPRVTFFLQPRAVPGIVDNVRMFLETVAALSRPVSAAIRLHPADEDTAFFEALVSRTCPGTAVVRPRGPVEPELCRTDVVVTCFSTIGLDHNYLQLFSARPIGCLAYLAAGSELRAFMRDVIGSDDVPGAEVGMGVMLHAREEFAGWIEDALSGDRERVQYERAVRRNLGAIGQTPSDRIAAYIIAETSGRSSRSRSTDS